MTEFESAQLVYIQAEREANLLSLIHSQAELIQNDATQFTTLLFGYLLVAYFIGAHLTRAQVIILNILYSVSIGATMFQMTSSAFIALGFLERFLEVSTLRNTDLSAINPGYIVFAVILNIALVITSLYFMWTIRQPKIE